MNYNELKDEIKEIGNIAESVPDAFREKCFELLLNHLLSGQVSSANPPPPPSDSKESLPPRQGNITLPSHVKAFMRRKNVTQDQIEALVMIEDDEFHFIKELEHGQAAKGQMDWALMIALKSGIQNNTLKADPEEIRSMVQEKGLYDSTNFASNFKKVKYAGLFKGPLERQGDAQALSSDGEAALAELIKELSGIS